VVPLCLESKACDPRQLIGVILFGLWSTGPAALVIDFILVPTRRRGVFFSVFFVVVSQSVGGRRRN